MLIDMETILQARSADLIDFLQRRCGFTFATHGGAYRCKQHPSLAVKGDRLSWFWHSKSVGGRGVLDYLTKIESMKFREAVETVTGLSPAIAPQHQEEQRQQTLILPEKAGIPLRLYDYLCVKRGIYRGIVSALLNEGKIYEDRRGNVVFVAHDELGTPRFASVRGTNDYVYRVDCNGSDKRYGFNMTYSQSPRLYLYESPIDAMSAATLYCIALCDMGAWRRRNCLSLAGTSDTALPKYLETHPHVKDLIFSLDNDAPGREAAERLMMKYSKEGFNTRISQPIDKDYSEDLQIMVREIQAEKARIKREYTR